MEGEQSKPALGLPTGDGRGGAGIPESEVAAGGLALQSRSYAAAVEQAGQALTRRSGLDAKANVEDKLARQSSSEIALNHASPSNVKSAIEGITSHGGVQVQVDNRGRWALAGTEKDLADAEQMVRVLDTPTKQVVIESHLHETPQPGVIRIERSDATAGEPLGVVRDNRAVVDHLSAGVEPAKRVERRRGTEIVLPDQGKAPSLGRPYRILQPTLGEAVVAYDDPGQHVPAASLDDVATSIPLSSGLPKARVVPRSADATSAVAAASPHTQDGPKEDLPSPAPRVSFTGFTQLPKDARLIARLKTPQAQSANQQTLREKLNRISIDSANYDGLPLAEVVRLLNEEIQKAAITEERIDFLLDASERHLGDKAAVSNSFDPITGLPLSSPDEASTDLPGTLISVKSGDNQMTLAQVLDAITNGSQQPITYSIEDYGVVFASAKDKDQPASVNTDQDPPPSRKPSPDAPTPQPEVRTAANPISTFSLNVSDVSFKLAAASLEKRQMPDVATVRSEEFLNAFNYRDPAPTSGQPLAFAWERARYPFAHNRDLLRFSVQTAARGREPGRPLNLVLLLDNSGSMERADRVSIIRECLNVLGGTLAPQDKVSVVTFARTARLWVDGVPGVQAAASIATAGQLTPEGGTNLEEAMNLAYATARRHYLAEGVNRVVLLTDGAANLGNVEPESLKARVEAQRKQGVALDCFGIGWEGYNDDLLEVLSRNGDGRYGFVNTPQDAPREFAAQLAGALQVAASDVKVQVEFNPARVTAYRQIGYARHQLTKEQFRDNTVDAAEIGAAESGNALYVIQTNPQGQGPLGTVRARFKVPTTGEYKEYEWTVPYTGEVVGLDDASPAMRLAASASAFSEWLVASPYAGDVTPERLLTLLRGVPEVFGADPRPTKLEWMIREAARLVGN
jgi:Mg-chelatase subunit ChlD